MAEVPKELMSQHHGPSTSVLSLKSDAGTVKTTRAPPSTIKTVVTSPPWARDEPPSPTDEDMLSPSVRGSQRQSDSGRRPSDAASYASHSTVPNTAVSWSSFIPKPRLSTRGPAIAVNPEGESDTPLTLPDGLPPTSKPTSPPRSLIFSLRDRSKSWLSPSSLANANAATNANASGPSREGISADQEKTLTANGSGSGSADTDTPDGSDQALHAPPRMHDRGLTIRMPQQADPEQQFTMHQARTPGWQSPWTPRLGTNGQRPDDYWRVEHDPTMGSTAGLESGSLWQRRRKLARAFLLNNVYVPLLFRFINITFTAAALAVAVRIRTHEMNFHLRGVLGSSPLIVIIFAPLTLVHVVSAVYLEYFGRPLGLWRTSHKLAHTLFEVAFICAWSAALSLCFDNFFTSYLPCASLGSISWYNELPHSNTAILPQGTPDYIKHTLCKDQLILIVLVGIGLIVYCLNLVISLYRIFEKVKHHQRGWNA